MGGEAVNLYFFGKFLFALVGVALGIVVVYLVYRVVSVFSEYYDLLIDKEAKYWLVEDGLLEKFCKEQQIDTQTIEKLQEERMLRKQGLRGSIRRKIEKEIIMKFHKSTAQQKLNNH